MIRTPERQSEDILRRERAKPWFSPRWRTELMCRPLQAALLVSQFEQNLRAGTTVTIAGVAAMGVSVESATRITSAGSSPVGVAVGDTNGN